MIRDKSQGSRRLALAAAALASLALLAGCGGLWADDPKEEAPAYAGYLFMTDTNSGKVFTYDPAARAASPTSFAAVGQKNAGEIAFYAGIGYVAVGYGTGQGVYSFDPAAGNPSFSKLGGSIAAQYFAFVGPTKAYVSSYGGGLYSFDPSNRAAGLSASPVAGTEGLTLQEIAYCGGYLYAADNGNGKILRIDPATGTVVATISASAAGTTGIAAGSLGAQTGVFVANTGGYDSLSYAPLPGSIDFLSHGASAASQVVSSAGPASIHPARLAQTADGSLVATGYGNTYRITFSGGAATAAELLAGGASFGSFDLACKGGLVYIPSAVTSDYVSYSNQLYILDAGGAQAAWSPVTVMPTATDAISNLAFYED